MTLTAQVTGTTTASTSTATTTGTVLACWRGWRAGCARIHMM